MYHLLILFISLFIILILDRFYRFEYFDYNQLNLVNTTSLCWTGGYDSTFRLLQLLVDEKKKVQPIYFCSSDFDSNNIYLQRKNKEKELETMHKICNKIHQQYPFTKKLLKPLLVIYYIRENPNVEHKIKYLHYQLKKFSRPHTQYERIARFSTYYPSTLEISVEKCGTGLDHATIGNRIGIGAECRIKDNLMIKYQPLDVFKKFRFPIVHLTKNDMKQIAENNGYINILKMTWSCWYPNKDGRGCGKCDMCRHRII